MDATDEMGQGLLTCVVQSNSAKEDDSLPPQREKV